MIWRCIRGVCPQHFHEWSLPGVFTYTLGRSKLSKFNSHKLMRYRWFKRFDLNNFQKDVSTSKLEIVEIPLTSDRSLKHFYEILNGTLNKHAPIKGKNVVLKRFSVSGVWYLDVREDIHERNKLKQEKKMKDYKKIRNQITSMLRKKKRNFYNDAIKPNPTHVCMLKIHYFPLFYCSYK